MLTTLMFPLSLVSWLSVDGAMELYSRQQDSARDTEGAVLDLDERKPPQFT